MALKKIFIEVVYFIKERNYMIITKDNKFVGKNNKENIVDTMKQNANVWKENIGINSIFFKTAVNKDNRGK